MRFDLEERVETFSPDNRDATVSGHVSTKDGFVAIHLLVGERGHVVSVPTKGDRLRALSAGLSPDMVVRVRFDERGDGEFFVREDRLDSFNSALYKSGTVLDCWFRHGDWRVIVRFDGGPRPRDVQLDPESIIRVDVVSALADLA